MMPIKLLLICCVNVVEEEIHMTTEKIYDVIIIGAGPAPLTAAVVYILLWAHTFMLEWLLWSKWLIRKIIISYI